MYHIHQPARVFVINLSFALKRQKQSKICRITRVTRRFALPPALSPSAGFGWRVLSITPQLTGSAGVSTPQLQHPWLLHRIIRMELTKRVDGKVPSKQLVNVALQATLLNAKVNGIMDNVDELDVRNDNLIGNGAATTRYDIVLIGDLFYDTEIAAVLHPWIQRLARAGKKIYIGDPGRHGITDTGVLSNMILHARYELPDNVCLENNGFSHANVWQYQLSTEEKD